MSENFLGENFPLEKLTVGRLSCGQTIKFIIPEKFQGRIFSRQKSFKAEMLTTWKTYKAEKLHVGKLTRQKS